ncbi:MAG: exodeoxyribonuclease V subunit beta [Deltaproteobacteria bacterium]|nr:exodeoxyribonuclease V subunit beta [Deltaproteobacteria bacterium]
MTNQFDLLNNPLGGTNLIEASAGTGKTYTISGLFLRLILEQNYDVGEILVVTFTEAATAELKERIRNRLGEAVRVFSGEASDDVFLSGLAEKHVDSKTALVSLKEALRSFDQAAIFTIHAFCRRMLTENAFESGNLFDTELVTDLSRLKREVSDDFWRGHFYRASPLFVQYAIDSHVAPDELYGLLSDTYCRPHLKIIPEAGIPDSSDEEREYLEYFHKVCSAWKSSRDDVEKLLMEDEGLNRTRYGKSKIPRWVQLMDAYVSSPGNQIESCDWFKKFTAKEIRSSVKKHHAPPEHPFFELCEDLCERRKILKDIFEDRLLGLKQAFFSHVDREFARRKTEENVLSFDDLLLKLRNALEGRTGDVLARSIRAKFKAALIDEFQDTDPIQYAIFRKVFGTKDGVLFLIGDPKQAIYSFRGADIFTYIEAAQDAEARYTLDRNWRSSPDLIRAVNTIFTQAINPFIYRDISYGRSVPGLEHDGESSGGEDHVGAPFRIWFVDAHKTVQSEKPLTKTAARELIPKAVAAEISRLLRPDQGNRVTIGGTPLREEDIAVLVRKNIEARLMQGALSAFGIPSVLCSAGNIYDSHEALEIERILSGLADPNDENLIKGALSTDMFGMRGEDLDDLMNNETAWEKRLLSFRRYHDAWHKHGFVRMFRSLIETENIIPRLMSLHDGERRTTNLMHLSEILHQASLENSVSMTGLLQWFSDRRKSSLPDGEENQLRLESDENAVKIVTVHKSKGLEYPVVFCPFLWDGSKVRNPKKPFLFHDEENGRRLTLDLGSGDMDRNRAFAEQEQLAENMRLLYVALTRAKERCYLVWGRFNEAETSAPAYLFHRSDDRDNENVIERTEKHFKTLNDETLFNELKSIRDMSQGAISLCEMPIRDDEKSLSRNKRDVQLTCRTFSVPIDREWRLASFSSLISGRSQDSEVADRDTILIHDTSDDPGDDKMLGVNETPVIFSFPRGAKAGTCLHDILEHLDFIVGTGTSIQQLVGEKLAAYGFDAAWNDTICGMIRNIVTVPLEPERNYLTLSSIRNEDRLNELEFYFPLRSISTRGLNRLFEKHTESPPVRGFPERIERLHFAPARGFMRGCIDMVFGFEGRYYLVDWKSNYLGDRVNDYGQNAMAAVMEKEFYNLQYYIYSMALHQYLRLRLPGYDYERHFGGIFYVFLRGVDPLNPHVGIYRDRPSEELIGELCEQLITGREARE